jgi:hypothetical protein
MIRIAINLFDPHGSRKHRKPENYDSLILQAVDLVFMHKVLKLCLVG